MAKWSMPLFFLFFSLITAWNGFWQFFSFSSQFLGEKSQIKKKVRGVYPPYTLSGRPLKKHLFYVCLPLVSWLKVTGHSPVYLDLKLTNLFLFAWQHLKIRQKGTHWSISKLDNRRLERLKVHEKYKKNLVLMGETLLTIKKNWVYC